MFGKEILDFKVGDIVCVGYKVIEGMCLCVQMYEGVVILCKGGGIGVFFIVCKILFGEGVECVFLLYLINVDLIIVVCCGCVCCVKLYYLCDCCGKLVCIVEVINYKFKVEVKV